MSPATAWISSTITVPAVASAARLPWAVSRMYNDSGVVIRMWGGRRSIRARSRAGVSPERTVTRISGSGLPPGHHISMAAPNSRTWLRKWIAWCASTPSTTTGQCVNTMTALKMTSA